MDSSVVVEYLLDLDERGCGPTVISSVRMAVKWIGKRLSLAVPDMDALTIKAIETQVIEKRAQETTEAIALPMDLLRVMEEICGQVLDP